MKPMATGLTSLQPSFCYAQGWLSVLPPGHHCLPERFPSLLCLSPVQNDRMPINGRIRRRPLLMTPQGRNTTPSTPGSSLYDFSQGKYKPRSQAQNSQGNYQLIHYDSFI